MGPLKICHPVLICLILYGSLLISVSADDTPADQSVTQDPSNSDADTSTDPIMTTTATGPIITATPPTTTTAPLTTVIPTTTVTPTTTVAPVPVISPPVITNPSSYILCPAIQHHIMCIKTSKPVCAYIKDCAGGSCIKTVVNSCYACSDANIVGYVDGSCQSLTTKCQRTKAQGQVMCPAIYMPVCAIADNCQGPDCSRTESNSCSACDVFSGADRYIPGECPPKPEDNKKKAYCDFSNRPTVCGRNKNSVCGVTEGCLGNHCRRSYSNSCKACMDSDTTYYIDGECKRY